MPVWLTTNVHWDALRRPPVEQARQNPVYHGAKTQSVCTRRRGFLNHFHLEIGFMTTWSNSMLSEDEQAACEGSITKAECLKSLKAMDNNKSPGSDGFPCEFYKFFWNDIGENVVDSFNYAYNQGQLSIDQRRGLITLLPKKDKDRLLLKNWRPVALLNTDYKILAKTLANRLKPYLEQLIHPDQTGYI